jgi:hypothetical protein
MLSVRSLPIVTGAAGHLRDLRPRPLGDGWRNAAPSDCQESSSLSGSVDPSIE